MRLVYFSPVPWASFAQRPHQFVNWFQSQFDAEVLWIDPYPTRLPAFADVRRLCAAVWSRVSAKEAQTASKAIENLHHPHWLSVLAPRAMPIEPLPGGVNLNRRLWRQTQADIAAFIIKGETQIVIGKPSMLALDCLALHPQLPSMYDAMDDFPAFYSGLSRLSMRRCENTLAATVKQITTSSSTVPRFESQVSKLHIVLNACASASLPTPKPVAARNQQIVLGYVGTIGHWFDWQAVIALANCLKLSHPQACIRLIGPLFTPPPQALPDNIELLPACAHAQAITAMQDFTVGLIPFKRNRLTASVDPIKYYEYRALGLPVMSTNFGEMRLRAHDEGVFIFDEKCDLSTALAVSLQHRSSAHSMMKFREDNSWDARFAALKHAFNTAPQRSLEARQRKMKSFVWQQA